MAVCRQGASLLAEAKDCNEKVESIELSLLRIVRTVAHRQWEPTFPRAPSQVLAVHGAGRGHETRKARPRPAPAAMIGLVAVATLTGPSSNAQ